LTIKYYITPIISSTEVSNDLETQYKLLNAFITCNMHAQIDAYTYLDFSSSPGM